MDDLLIEALAGNGDEWTTAEAVQRRAFGIGRDRPSTLSVGIALSRLARAGRCEKRLNAGGYMNEYRATWHATRRAG